MDRNKFIEKAINPNDIGHIESMFALGNGYLGIRGTYDEEDTGIDQEREMYINGIFDTEPISHPWYCKGFASRAATLENANISEYAKPYIEN